MSRQLTARSVQNSSAPFTNRKTRFEFACSTMIAVVVASTPMKLIVSTSEAAVEGWKCALAIERGGVGQLWASYRLPPFDV
jgi:hypothetical protein